MYYHLTQKIVPFLLTFGVSALLAITLQSFLRQEAPPAQPELSVAGSGSGFGSGPATGETSHARTRPATAPLRITFQPKATYTDAARENDVQGAVRLKIVLLADGTVGPITPVTELPYGLTERAIAAARQIKFEPKKINGEAVSVVITREYVFTIY